MFLKTLSGKSRMKSQSLIIIALAVITLGCAHTHKINLNSESSIFNEINAKLKSQKARITLATGREFIGKGPQIARDSTFWFDPGTNDKYTVSTLEVEEIVTLKRTRGAWEGFKFGALIGAAAGLILCGLTDAEEDPKGYGPDLDTWGWTVMFGINAGLIGLPIGAIVGSKDKYILIAPNDSL